MIGMELAQQLRDAGLRWQPTEQDTFAIPDSQMEQQVFLISQFNALVQLYQGQPVVTFHGSTEWALDYVLLTDVVWMPSEAQVREQLSLAIGADSPLRLDRTANGYRCQIALGDRVLDFDADNGANAYGMALLSVLQQRSSGDDA